MGKFSGILICTDLDGTLYKNDKTISKENKDAIEYFKKEGGLFTFVTGRLPYYSMWAYEAVSPNAPFGCINGGGLYDGEADRYVCARVLPNEFTELVGHIEKNFPEVGLQICCLDKTYFARETPQMKRFRAMTGLPDLFCHYLDVKEPVGKALFGTECEEEMQAVIRALHEHPLACKFSFIRSERTLYEILPKGTHKGLSIDKLSEHLGMDKSRIVAVGDYDNDVGMLKAAGLGIAVANATPAAREAADAMTVSNEEHAIADVIYGIESGKYKLN